MANRTNKKYNERLNARIFLLKAQLADERDRHDEDGRALIAARHALNEMTHDRDLERERADYLLGQRDAACTERDEACEARDRAMIARDELSAEVARLTSAGPSPEALAEVAQTHAACEAEARAYGATPAATCSACSVDFATVDEALDHAAMHDAEQPETPAEAAARVKANKEA